jgi:hypothetical protein
VGVNVGSNLGAGVKVGATVGVAVKVGAGAGVKVGLFVGVAVKVGLLVGVAVGTGVKVGLFVGVTVKVGATIGAGVKVGVRVDAGVTVALLVGVGVDSGVGVLPKFSNVSTSVPLMATLVMMAKSSKLNRIVISWAIQPERLTVNPEIRIRFGAGASLSSKCSTGRPDPASSLSS